MSGEAKLVWSDLSDPSSFEVSSGAVPCAEYVTSIPAGWNWVMGPGKVIMACHPDYQSREFDLIGRVWSEFDGVRYRVMEPQP